MNKLKSRMVWIFVMVLLQAHSFGQSKIRAYFNTPVNNSLSTGVPAVYLPGAQMADTIAAYIKRAKYSVDIAQYDYNQNSTYGAYANIAAAADTAYAHGITVRWIYDGSSSNTGLSALNPGIHKLASPTGTAYGIMHNKFIIIDANSSDPGDAIVCDGSADWSSTMFYKDYNNILFIQDSALAHAFTGEFNMMWGSTTAVPNATLSKFGPFKTDLGHHMFNIAGHTVELYFSPSDNTDAHVGSTILTANKDLYVGVYDMTRTTDASNIVTAKNNGAYTIAIVDQYTPATSTAVNATLSAGLGSNYVVYSSPSFIYHNKMMIVDPSDTCSDPLVLTGSYNWTTSGNSYNDENILILHNDTLANIYYQSFIADFTAISGGSFVTPLGGCNVTLGAPAALQEANQFSVYPNPADNLIHIAGANEEVSLVDISDMLGQHLFTQAYHNEACSIDVSFLPKGIYFIAINHSAVSKLVKN